MCEGSSREAALKKLKVSTKTYVDFGHKKGWPDTSRPAPIEYWRRAVECRFNTDFTDNERDTLLDMVMDEQGSVENSRVFTDQYKKEVLPELESILSKLCRDDVWMEEVIK